MLQMTAFSGEIPKLIPRLLPDGAAQIAQNCKLQNGAIVPLHAPSPYRTLAVGNVMFFKSGATWFEWDKIVDVAAAPIAANRLYVTGDGAPKLIVDGSTVYSLAVPRPASALTATGKAVQTTISIPYNASPSVVQSALASLVGVTSISCTGSSLPSGTINVLFTGDVAMRSMPTLAVDESTLSGGSGSTITIEHKQYGGPGVYDKQSISIIGSPTAGNFTLSLWAPDPASQESIVYAYTYVTQFDEESEPSDVSNEVLRSFGIDVTLTGFSAPPAGRGINRIRLYRSQTSASGATELYFIKELATTTTTFLDGVDTIPIQEVIPSLEYNAPPATLQGIITLPNGIMAAFDGKKLYFSEPWKPHAWPEKYILTTNFDIVGLAAFGQSIAVLTTGEPYIVTGNAPDSMVMTRVEVNYPCVSKRSIVDLGYSVAYATTDGIAVISSNGATLASKGLFTPKQWRAYNPSSIIAGQFEGRYLMAFTATSDGSTIKGAIIVDLTGDQGFISRVDADIDFMFFEVGVGTLYILQGQAASLWDDPSADFMSYRWRSKKFILPGTTNFGAALIECEGASDPYIGIPQEAASSKTGAAVSAVPDGSTSVYADGTLIHSFSDANVVARLPGGFTARTWEVEVSGKRAVTSITLAQSPSELAMGGGQ